MDMTSILLGVASVAIVPIATTLTGYLMKARTLLHLQTTAQDQTNMEAQIEAAIGAGIAEVAKTAPQVIADGITTPKAWADVVDAASRYFNQRFPERSAQIASAANAESIAGGNAAVQQTIAARLPNVNSAMTQTPGPGGAASGSTA